MRTSILCLLVSLIVSSVVAQDEFNKVLGVAIDKGCMESVLFMPKACEAGGTSDVFSNGFRLSLNNKSCSSFIYNHNTQNKVFDMLLCTLTENLSNSLFERLRRRSATQQKIKFSTHSHKKNMNVYRSELRSLC